MEPTIIDLNLVKTLLNPITINEEVISEINVKMLILRPYLKRIVFITEELDRIIIYEGEELYEAHKDDSQADLEVKLLAVIEAQYNA